MNKEEAWAQLKKEVEYMVKETEKVITYKGTTYVAKCTCGFCPEQYEVFVG